MIDRGHGVPFVLVNGIQGRWEWTAQAVDALAARGRVLTYSLSDEPTSGFSCDPARGFDNYLDQVDACLDRAGLDEAIIVGVSFGGLIASEFAARRPARTRGLILVSSLPYDWTPDARVRWFLRAPHAVTALFSASAVFRFYPELATALPGLGPKARLLTSNSRRLVSAFPSPTRMARRVRWAQAHAFADSALIEAPTLIVTGEAGLDHVVPTRDSERGARGLRNVERAILERTGHLGIVTRANAFADIAISFANRLYRAPAGQQLSNASR